MASINILTILEEKSGAHKSFHKPKMLLCAERIYRPPLSCRIKKGLSLVTGTVLNLNFYAFTFPNTPFVAVMAIMTQPHICL